MKQWILILLCGVAAASVSMAATAPATNTQANPDPGLNANNPVAPTVPSSQAVDMQTFEYESQHDVETMSHSNTPPDDAAPAKPLPDAVVRQDVMNRFNKVYQEKKTLYDQAQNDLVAAKNDLAQCDTLSAAEKPQCVKAANVHIEVITQKISNLTYDMNVIKKEMQSIQPGQ